MIGNSLANYILLEILGAINDQAYIMLPLNDSSLSTQSRNQENLRL